MEAVGHSLIMGAIVKRPNKSLVNDLFAIATRTMQFTGAEFGRESALRIDPPSS